MKCPRCFSLNCDTDPFCIGCRSPLASARQAATAEAVKAATPQWAYFFAAVCAGIPVVTLGGAIPAALGLGGAGACIGVARAYSVPAPLRFVVCLGITLICWLLLVTLILEMMPGAKARFHKLIH